MMMPREILKAERWEKLSLLLLESIESIERSAKSDNS
jgi:hypothetical protein